ncbi:MAG TPA: nuclear transport factor 2 family protein [Rhizobacter sp.]|nr:nuclear transport factor 2 family protein [Rhizobacter sp.]
MIRPKPLDAALMASPDDTEQQFYEALQRGDIDKLMAVWSDDDDIICVHPGGPRVMGPAAIRATFEAMFSNGAIDARPEKVRRVVTQGSAVHSVLERIRVSTAHGEQVAWVISTNVYVKTTQGWRIVTHHASPGSPHEIQDVGEPASTLH